MKIEDFRNNITLINQISKQEDLSEKTSFESFLNKKEKVKEYNQFIVYYRENYILTPTIINQNVSYFFTTSSIPINYIIEQISYKYIHEKSLIIKDNKLNLRIDMKLINKKLLINISSENERLIQALLKNISLLKDKLSLKMNIPFYLDLKINKKENYKNKKNLYF